MTGSKHLCLILKGLIKMSENTNWYHLDYGMCILMYFLNTVCSLSTSLLRYTYGKEININLKE